MVQTHTDRVSDGGGRGRYNSAGRSDKAKQKAVDAEPAPACVGALLLGFVPPPALSVSPILFFFF